MVKARISDVSGRDAVDRALATVADRDTEATAVRYLLQVLAEGAPGNSVEVRVPPFGAVQCIEGPGHTRGTPPNVVETDALTWLAIATGGTAWAVFDEMPTGSELVGGAIMLGGLAAAVVSRRPRTPAVVPK